MMCSSSNIFQIIQYNGSIPYGYASCIINLFYSFKTWCVENMYMSNNNNAIQCNIINKPIVAMNPECGISCAAWFDWNMLSGTDDCCIVRLGLSCLMPNASIIFLVLYYSCRVWRNLMCPYSFDAMCFAICELLSLPWCFLF